jgi:serine-type D-Ala-D-Ala endopeptidase (penicillin-binding protein 7)
MFRVRVQAAPLNYIYPWFDIDKGTNAVRFSVWLTMLCVFMAGFCASESYAAGRPGAKKTGYHGKKHKLSRKHIRKTYFAPAIPDETSDGKPNLQSASAIVLDQINGTELFGKNTDNLQPIASITKLMTAMIVLDSKQDMDEPVIISNDDIDVVKGSHSNLPVGSVLKRTDMLRLALMSSENRAASALARNYPGGKDAFVAKMNERAQMLKMARTRFTDSTGLMSENVSTVKDLARMVDAAYRYDLIREYTTTPAVQLTFPETGLSRGFSNTNRLINNSEWQIGLSKTGFIKEAGQCLVMQARIGAKPVLIVLLDSWGKLSRVADATRIKKWIENHRYEVAMAVSDKG